MECGGKRERGRDAALDWKSATRPQSGAAPLPHLFATAISISPVGTALSERLHKNANCMTYW